MNRQDEYTVVGAFRKKDGSLTPDMTAEEVRQGKYQEYGITSSQIKGMLFRYHKVLIEGAEDNVKVSLKGV